MVGADGEVVRRRPRLDLLVGAMGEAPVRETLDVSGEDWGSILSGGMELDGTLLARCRIYRAGQLRTRFPQLRGHDCPSRKCAPFQPSRRWTHGIRACPGPLGDGGAGMVLYLSPPAGRLNRSVARTEACASRAVAPALHKTPPTNIAKE